MSTVIKVENISKQYRLGDVGTGSLSHDLNRTWHRIRGKEDPYLKIGEVNDRTVKGSSEYVWALQDINFEVKLGEVLGIIGRNGAGKSTLLKILSRTTTPTTGQIKIKGRVASLLEVGTGFHPELSGRENIFLNGAILGMTRQEIKSKFDEIVDFSGVERYIDTPVKRYSSGMYVRLAFGVAAHLEPEILIVDEVLAVGDVEFQKKALGKMKDVSQKGGRTVLFVSHNMAAVKSLCNKAVVLQNGVTLYEGEVNLAISKHLMGVTEFQNKRAFVSEHENDIFQLIEIEVRVKDSTILQSPDEFDQIELVTKIKIKKNAEGLRVVFVLKNEEGDAIFTFSHPDGMLDTGINNIVCTLPKSFLNVGSYFLDFYLNFKRRETLYVEKDILYFNIQEGVRDLGVWMGRDYGIIKPVFEWRKV
jgi:lipopolysaccharide transport system ATP-binding protein